MAAPFWPSCLPFVYSVSLLVNWLLGFWRQDIGCRSRQEQLVKRTKKERHPRIQFTFPADQRSRDLNTVDNVDKDQNACKDNLCFPKDFFSNRDLLKQQQTLLSQGQQVCNPEFYYFSFPLWSFILNFIKPPFNHVYKGKFFKRKEISKPGFYLIIKLLFFKLCLIFKLCCKLYPMDTVT